MRGIRLERQTEKETELRSVVYNGLIELPSGKKKLSGIMEKRRAQII